MLCNPNITNVPLEMLCINEGVFILVLILFVSK